MIEITVGRIKGEIKNKQQQCHFAKVRVSARRWGREDPSAPQCGNPKGTRASLKPGFSGGGVQQDLRELLKGKGPGPSTEPESPEVHTILVPQTPSKSKRLRGILGPSQCIWDRYTISEVSGKSLSQRGGGRDSGCRENIKGAQRQAGGEKECQY